jgi:phosphatidylglycerol:prolipoprotein diacylglycerol transferase
MTRLTTMAFPYLSDVIESALGIRIPLPIPTFGLLVVTALSIATLVFREDMARRFAAGAIGPALRRIKNAAGVPEDRWLPPQTIAADLCVTITLAGIVGARLFSILEYPDAFLADPLGQIFSRSGFTYYGGLIVGSLAGILFVRRCRLPVLTVLDSIAPSLMLGYGIGRIGCQISGDGDWGIAANLAAKPAWLPTWSWAQTYDHNVLGVVLPEPGVYPTPIYETALSLMVFAILFALRRNQFRAGWLFCVYLASSGLERLAIEQIRVNTQLHFLGITATQAEVISTALIAGGGVGMVVLARKSREPRDA